MMKWFAVACLLSLATPVMAADEQEMKALQFQLAAFEWEYRYCNERMQVLQSLAREIQAKIQDLQKRLGETREQTGSGAEP